MIRRRLHRRWRARRSDGEALLCCFRELTMWTWLDRYHDWHVRTFGEKPNPSEPLWSRLLGHLMLWLTDWRTTLAQRRPWERGEWARLKARIDKQEP